MSVTLDSTKKFLYVNESMVSNDIFLVRVPDSARSLSVEHQMLSNGSLEVYCSLNSYRTIDMGVTDMNLTGSGAVTSTGIQILNPTMKVIGFKVISGTWTCRVSVGY